MQLTTSTSAPLNNDDAVAIVQEFFSSMDNLPGEVAFLLQEIKSKDDKVSDLSRRNIARTSAVYKSIRPTHQPPTCPPISVRDASNLQKIDADWIRIEELSREKVVLAERLVSIVTRARERGRDEWRKVGGDEAVEEEAESEATQGMMVGVGMGMGIGMGIGMPGLAGMGAGGVAVGQSQQGMGLINSLQKSQLVQQYAVSSPVDDKAIKKRKTNPSYYTDMPPPPTPYSSSALSNQSTIVYQDRPYSHSQSSRKRDRGREDQSMEMDFGGGGGGDAEEEGGEGEDEKVYCFCQEKSYGEMIGCDNDACKREWFHLKCVKLEPPLPEQWYCSECQAIADMAAAQAQARKNKGRKK